MGKPGLGLFTGRRKSSANILQETSTNTAPSPEGYASPQPDSGAFRLMSRTEVEKAKVRRQTMEKEKSSKFPRFSGFGGVGHKGRVQSFEDDSPGSSKRDSKSSNGTQFSASRPYANGQHGSTSTLPSSTDTSSDDNLFASIPRPQIPQHNSSPNTTTTYSMSNFRKQLPSLPKSSSGVSQKSAEKFGRDRAMTASSYASTAVAPKLEAELNFGNSDFEDMFSEVDRKSPPIEAPKEAAGAGRSLLLEKRAFQADPIEILPKFDVEAPLASWDSRGSNDNLMSSTRSDSDSPPPPPPPPHKYSHYAPVASESPTLTSSGFHDTDAPALRKSVVDTKPYRDTSPEQHAVSMTSSSATSLQTPASSRSSNYTPNTTPKAPLAQAATSPFIDHHDDDLFTPIKIDSNSTPSTVRQSTGGQSASSNGKGRVMTQQEWAEMQKRQRAQPSPQDDSEEEDYEDEEDAIKQRQDEEIMRRKQQQMHFAREAMRRTTTAPPGLSHGDSLADTLGMGFPSETSIKADEWEDEDVPLGILAQHGFPSQTRNRVPSQPANATPSYFPDRPASAGPLSNGATPGSLPAFARNLPADPHTSFIGGGLVRHMNRESMGFNSFSRGPASVAGDSIAGGVGMGVHTPLMYQDAGLSQPSLVDQIQMRDMTKQKYMGGASNKKPEGGPFTGMLGQQMNARGQQQNTTRMSQMPMMNGMNPMMSGMMGGGQMPMMGMGMNQMGFPMSQPNDFMQMQQMQQMQQMIAMQQMQLQQMQMQQPQPPQDPRMSMALGSNGFGGNMMGNGSFLNIPNSMPSQQNRPMSFMTVNGNQQPPTNNFLGPGPGYTPSIAPSERSNIGLSARYRSVVNNSDAHSTGTSMTLQASSGANNQKPGMVKGILKPSPRAQADEDEGDWGKMAARKSKFTSGTSHNPTQSSGLEELTKGLNI